MKNKKILLLLLALSLIVSCGKDDGQSGTDNVQDYRDVWVGDYSYTCHKYSWNPRGSGPDYYTDGMLSVKAEEDSCIRITLREESKSWLCKVYDSGALSLIGNEYRAFNGLFHNVDSLHFHCSNFSPGAGTGWDYDCKKK